MSTNLPSKSSLVIVRSFDGTIVCGEVNNIQTKYLELSKASTLKVIGLKMESEPIYEKKNSIPGTVGIRLDSIVFWESLPDDIKL